MCQIAKQKKSGDGVTKRQTQRDRGVGTYGTLGDEPVFDKGHVLVIHLLHEPEGRQVEQSRIQYLPVFDLLLEDLSDPEKVGEEPFDGSYDHGSLRVPDVWVCVRVDVSMVQQVQLTISSKKRSAVV